MKKLTLVKETLRWLAADPLAGVFGGDARGGQMVSTGVCAGSTQPTCEPICPPTQDVFCNTSQSTVRTRPTVAGVTLETCEY